MPRRTSTARRKSRYAARKAVKRKWSAEVTQKSDALDLEQGVFAKARPADIARSLKRSAESSTRRKSEPYRSAMSMLTFFINRAGSSLSRQRLAVLERAKGELRKAFGKDKRQ
jgi:phosphoenolpyruvate carboxylase